MLWTRVNFKFCDEFPAEAVFWQHTLYRQSDQIFRFFRKHLGRSALANSSWIFGMPIINLPLKLLAAEPYAPRIHNDNKIASIRVGSIDWLVFAAQDFCYFGGHPTQNLSLRVNHVPLSLSTSF